MAQFAPQYSLFVIIDKIRSLISYVFWIIFLLSVYPTVSRILELKINVDDLLNTINIISITLFFILEVIVEYILIPQAESKRRDDFIDNSFGSSFTTNPSLGYFDNDEIGVGLYKAATNLFENSFFTYSLVKAVTIRKIIPPTILLLSVAVFAYYGFKQVPFVLSLLQAIFSATLLGELVKHFVLMIRLNAIQDSWITLFQNREFKSNVYKYETIIYRYWLQYETLHSRIQSGIPDRVFKKLNPILTEEWKILKKRYNIN
jgi:hypothetical protein